MVSLPIFSAMDSGVERREYFKALAAQRARPTFRAEGACMRS
jgi:hypothetical protein